MPQPPPSPRSDSAPESAIVLPPGTPEWITPELALQTLKIFRPRSPKAQLSLADAVQILMSFGRLVDVLRRGEP